MKYQKLLLILLFPFIITAQSSTKVAELADKYNDEVIELRRHFHQFPELSNREFKTAERITEELVKIGLKPDTGIAITGVVAVLKGGKPGPTIGLRADIDGLPVTERTPIEFASKEKSEYLGSEVGVMHACGHDTHIAMLLGTAKVLKEMQDEIQGTIVFVFQPAEEGAPPGEEGGASLMVKEGLIENYGIEVMFGQHISSRVPVGSLDYKPAGIMAAADRFVIKVNGKQTHGSRPWGGVDPIVTAAQIIIGLQTIVSRQVNLTKEAAVISVGKITGGVRNNIIPEQVEMVGTIRTLDNEMQEIIHEKIRLTAEHIAASQGATVEVEIVKGAPVTFNNRELTQKMLPTLYASAGEENVRVIPAVTGAEDFAFYAQKVPSLFYFVGGRSLTVGKDEAFPHHTPDFFVDEAGMNLGVRTLSNLALDYGRMASKN